jgi:diguanylate cyclase (GGDEF)-like protein
MRAGSWGSPRPAWALQRRGVRGDAARYVAEHDSTPPVLRFALRVIDAVDTAALARVCANEMVDSFGALRARVLDPERVWIEAGAPPSETPCATISLRLSGPDEAVVRLEIAMAASEDLAIVRQQLLDLVSVARRAWLRLHQLEHERSAARSDALTGLANRRAIAEWLDGAYLHALHAGTPMSLMIVDLDRFKQVNDTHGHPAGDEVLQHAAACFRAHLRPSDRVCRWGGDEFLIALPGIDGQTAAVIAERLRTVFAADVRARGTTMTIGIADIFGLPDPRGIPAAPGAQELIALADECLLAAKRSGRNCTVTATRLREAG